jgi:glycosyltransferase involved in cell wall biosynthesis
MNHTIFFTPVLPSPAGGGSAIRAAATLQVLAETQPTIVVHCDCWGDTPWFVDASWCRGVAADVLLVRADRLQQVPALVADALAARGAAANVGTIHVFRQVLAPVGLACKERFAPRVTLLDLDDDECGRNRYFVPLHQRAGDHARAAALVAEERRARVVRGMLLPRFDRVFLSNPDECLLVGRELPAARIELLPNVVPPVTREEGVEADPERMLFLGTLDYLPNEDAVHWFVSEMLPRLRAVRPTLRLRVAGVGLPATLRPSLAAAGVDFAGAVRAVAPEFAGAGMLVVPLRAGTGTRIKILEAFRHGTPVVSTSIGAAGLGVVDGRELLIADTPDAMVAACLQVAGDPALRSGLATRAAAWVERHHSLAAMRTVLAAALEKPAGGSRGGHGGERAE